MPNSASYRMIGGNVQAYQVLTNGTPITDDNGNVIDGTVTANYGDWVVTLSDGTTFTMNQTIFQQYFALNG